MSDVNKDGVERFDLEQPETHMGLAYMQSESYGDYVRYSDYAILRTEKHADAECIMALRAELDAAITRAEDAEKARDEWCEVSQKNYQLARDMEKRLIDILYS